MSDPDLFKIEYQYKYIIDTCSILQQAPEHAYRRTSFKKLWNKVDTLISEQTIVLCAEIFDEVKNEDIIDILRRNNCMILPIDEDIQENVRYIVNTFPKILDFKKCRSSGDVFLIATAMKYNLTIITEEKKDSPWKIPQVASKCGVKTLNFLDFCDIYELIS